VSNTLISVGRKPITAYVIVLLKSRGT